MSELQSKDPKKPPVSNSRNDRLKQIDALYRSQLKQIHSEGKTKLNLPEEAEKNHLKIESQSKKIQIKLNQNNLQRVKSSGSFLNPRVIQSSKILGFGETERDPVRASTFLRGDTTKNIEMLRRENETKQLRIRQLTNKCEGLIDKLKQFMPSEDLQSELESLRDANSDRSERLERLFKIKTDEIFFKLKLKVVSLLQDFGVTREQLSESNDAKNDTELFTFLTKKLKDRLKDFRSREAESTFSLQKDRIVNQKQEQRIHFLTQTNELFKLSENKLKGKIEDLKGQLNEYIDHLKIREQENQERQSQFFRLKKQNQELQTVNQRLTNAVRGAQGEKSEERRSWEAREKELKQLLNTYNVDKQKLEAELEQNHGQIEEQMIRMKFLEQENQRLNREIIRWKERFEGLQKQKISKVKDLEDEKTHILNTFEQYKLNHNEGISIDARNEVQEALRSVEEYQVAYHQVLEQLEDERRLLLLSEEQSQEKFENQEREWLNRVKKLQQTKEEELSNFMMETQGRMTEIKQQFQQKQLLLVEELQARLKAQLAQRDKRNTEQLISLQSENDDLRRQIESLSKMLDVKESLISVLNGKKIAFE